MQGLSLGLSVIQNKDQILDCTNFLPDLFPVLLEVNSIRLGSHLELSL